MAALPMVLMVASTAMGAIGAVRQAQAQAGAMRYNAQIAEQNAQIANAQGAAAAEAQQREAQRRIGSAIASYGASGVDVGTGSPVDVLADSARQSALDNLTVKYNYKLRAQGYLNQAELDRTGASNAVQAGYMNATSALLRGGAQAYDMRPGGGTSIPTTG